MKKLFSLLCAAAMVLSASATPEFATRASKKNIGELSQTLPAVEQVSFDHSRLAATPATAVKKAPAAVSNGKIVADGAQAMLYPASMTKADAMYEFDFFSGEDFSAYVAVTANSDSSKLVGTYSVLEGQVVVAAGDTTDILSGSLAVTYVAPNYHFDLSVACQNGQTYTMELDYAAADMLAVDYMMYYYYMYGYIQDIESCLIELSDAPFVPTGNTIDVIISGVSSLTDYTSDPNDSWFQIIGEDAIYYVSVCVNTNHLIGSFGNADIDYDYTGVSTDGETLIYAKPDAANTVDVSASGDTTIVEASLLCKDGNIYHIIMKYYIPTPTKTIDVVLSGTVDADTYAEYGYVAFEAEDADYAISLLLPNQGAGTYELGDIYGMNDSRGSYFADMQTQYLIKILSANIVLAADYSFTAQFISADARQFNITFTPSKTAAINNTSAEEAKAQKVVRNGQLVIIKNGVEYNALGTQL